MARSECMLGNEQWQFFISLERINPITALWVFSDAFWAGRPHRPARARRGYKSAFIADDPIFTCFSFIKVWTPTLTPNPVSARLVITNEFPWATKKKKKKASEYEGKWEERGRIIGVALRMKMELIVSASLSLTLYYHVKRWNRCFHLYCALLPCVPFLTAGVIKALENFTGLML